VVEPGEDRFLSLVTVDWWETTVGLYINGMAHKTDDDEAKKSGFFTER